MKTSIQFISSLLLVCITTITLKAQSNTTASGGEATGAGGSVSYSIGQIDYINVSSGTGTITQGVQQPYEIFSMDITDNDYNISAVVYPNPSSNEITLDIVNEDFAKMEYCLYDIHGKLIQQKKIIANQTYISLVELAAGTYNLNIQLNNQSIRTFKIVKN